MPMKPDRAALLPAVRALAVQAGVEIMAIYRDEARWNVQSKNDDSPLTAADIAANKIIVAGLSGLTPDIPIISEESEEAVFTERALWKHCWLVDPLDGTKEFIARNDEFSVNIALIENGEAILGVVYAPVTQTAYVAARGLGAFRIDSECSTQIHVARFPEGRERALRIVASRRHRGKRDLDFCTEVEKELGPIELAVAGSAFKICAVAEGRADAYPRFGPTMEWDTAAGQVVVEEAGGVLVDERGRRFRYNQRETLLNESFLVAGGMPEQWLSIWKNVLP